MKRFILLVVSSLIGFVAAPAMAAAPDFTTLTAGVDYSTVGPALLAVAVLISGVYVIWKGAKMILSAIKTA